LQGRGVAGVIDAVQKDDIDEGHEVISEIRIASATAMKEVLTVLTAELERAAGCKIATAYATSGGHAMRIANGDVADLLLVAQPDTDGLMQQGKLLAGSDVVVARSDIGVGVRKGTPKPDISTADALKRALLAARTVAYTDPAAGGASGAYFEQVLRHMGIFDRIEPKLAAGGPNGLVGTLVVNGEAEIGVQQIPELIASGVELLGALPGPLARATAYVAAIPARAPHPEISKTLMTVLTSATAAAAIKAHGMTPS
jgi:molybdate transport system substrate-binding protein